MHLKVKVKTTGERICKKSQSGTQVVRFNHISHLAQLIVRLENTADVIEHYWSDDILFQFIYSSWVFFFLVHILPKFTKLL